MKLLANKLERSAYPIEHNKETTDDNGTITITRGYVSARPFKHGAEGVPADTLRLQAQIDSGTLINEVPPVKPTALDSVRYAAKTLNTIMNDATSFAPENK